MSRLEHGASREQVPSGSRDGESPGPIVTQGLIGSTRISPQILTAGRKSPCVAGTDSPKPTGFSTTNPLLSGAKHSVTGGTAYSGSPKSVSGSSDIPNVSDCPSLKRSPSNALGSPKSTPGSPNISGALDVTNLKHSPIISNALEIPQSGSGSPAIEASGATSPHRIQRKEIGSPKRRPLLSSSPAASYRGTSTQSQQPEPPPVRSISTPPNLESGVNTIEAQDTESTTAAVVREARQRILERGRRSEATRVTALSEDVQVLTSPKQAKDEIKPDSPKSHEITTPSPRAARPASRLFKRFSLLPSASSPRPAEDDWPSETSSLRTPPRPAFAEDMSKAVEANVTAYLASPRFSQKLRRPDGGRTISFSEVGDPKGSAVFCFVGMGLNRFITTFYDDLACSLHLRLITPERPGVGDSDRDSRLEDDPLRWPDDVQTICEALDITKFSLIAHSAGAIYALAVALHMPQQIRCRIHLLAPWIPPSQLAPPSTKQDSATAALPYSQRLLRSLPAAFLQAANMNFLRLNSGSAPPVHPRSSQRIILTDQDLLVRPEQSRQRPLPRHANRSSEHISERPARPSNPRVSTTPPTFDDRHRNMLYDSHLAEASWERATRGANPYRDLVICLERSKPIGFQYVDVTKPVVIHHGSRDTRVPIENVRWLSEQMRRCEVRVLDQEGHGLMANAQVMSNVFTEMAGEWDDWNRIVAGDTK